MSITKSIPLFIRPITIFTKTLRKLYDWTLNWSKTKYASPFLFILAFSESSFFPVPPDVLLIAMTVANRFKWWIFAFITTFGSVLGGILGYYIGVAFFETVGKGIVSFYHFEEYFEIVGNNYSENAFLAVFTAAFTPIPYKVFTIAGGVFKIPLQEFILASILGRGGRFFIVGAVLAIFGKRISNVIEKYFDIFSLAFIALLIIGFLLIRLLK